MTALRGRGGLRLAAALAVLIVCAACQPAQPGSGPAPGSPQPSRETLPAAAAPTGPDPTGPDPTGTAPAGSADRLLPLPAGAQAALVEHHTDGDTLAVRALAAGTVLSSTSQITVRLLEIDTPETHRPGTPIQCYGPESSARLAVLAPIGSKVYVTADRDRVDRYGRDLLYLWDASGRSINLALVEEGYATAVLYQPNDRYITVMRAAEARARAAKLGRWGACAAGAAPAPIPVAAPVPAPAVAPGRGNCDPAYPTVCIPPGPPDLDCGEISYRRFTVLAPDPHHFDADRDGIGCESG